MRLLPILLLALLPAMLHAQAPGLKVGDKAPPFTLKTINPETSGQKTVSLKSFLGAAPQEKKKAVLLTFSASYCAPCKKEFVRLKALEKKIKAANIYVAAVVIDRDKEGQDAMSKLVKDELAFPFPVLLDKYGILARRYKAESLPYLVVINPADGTVKSVHVGYKKAALDELLGGLGVKL